MGMALLYGGIILSVVAASAWMITCFDTNSDTKVWWLTEQEMMRIFWGSEINGVAILCISCNHGENQGIACLLAVVAGCLLFACITDGKTKEVYQFTWWIGGCVAVIILIQCFATRFHEGGVTVPSKKQLVMLFVYIILQEFFFDRFYGKADCHAFVICAVVECALGMGMSEYLLHMLMSFGSLAVVQLLRHNVGRSGNLRQAVAFLPYITFGFWVLLFFDKSVILKRILEINL